MDWTKPIEVDDATHAFPARVEGVLLPPREDLPEPYCDYNKHVPAKEAVSLWFFKGMKAAEFIPREDIDPRMALRQIGACLGSYEPQHEDKINGAGFLLATFFSKVKAHGKEFNFDLPGKKE